jgi:ABC-type nickel/cobalt efflux system permease component RcnA
MISLLDWGFLMNQDPQPQPWWKDNWLVLALVTLAMVIATITILGYWLRWSWTGLETKSAWDWLELLIIPIVLGAGALWFNRQERRAQNDLETRRQESEQALAREERKNNREIAEDRARDDALRSYFDRMSELLLDKNLGGLIRVM